MNSYSYFGKRLVVFFCGLNFVVVVDIIYTLTMEKKSHFIDIIFPTFKKRFLFSLPLILLFKFDLRLFFFHFYPPQWIIQSTDDAKVFDHSQIFIEVYWQNKQWHYLATFLPQTKLRLSLRWIKSTIEFYHTSLIPMKNVTLNSS